MNHPPPALATFTPAERRLIRRLRTPILVQRFLNQLPYNTEPKPDPETLRSLRQVLRHRTAHCLEAALAAACILEQHGFPPLVMSLKSIDYLDHVIFVYRERGRWGSVARSRDPGLHGRKTRKSRCSIAAGKNGRRFRRSSCSAPSYHRAPS